MKMTLLEMTQDILSAMGSDPASTISSTTETLQVAESIRYAYFNIMNEREWTHLSRITQLQSLALPNTNPTTYKIGDNIRNIDWIKFDKRPLGSLDKQNFQDIIYLTPDEFLTHTSSRDEINNPDVKLVLDALSGGIAIKLRTDVPPTYWTTFDEIHIVLDSYMSSISATVRNIDSMCKVVTTPAFDLVDSFIPKMPIQFFAVVLGTAKVDCFRTIKGDTHALAEREVKRQRVMLQHKARRVDDLYRSGVKETNYRGVNYGRT